MLPHRFMWSKHRPRTDADCCVIETLKRKGITIERYNLRDNPNVYIENKVVNKCLMDESADVLPVTLVDGEIAVKKAYPTNKQIAEWLDINEEELTVKQ